VRRVFDALLESLDATVRIARRQEGEELPAPLEQSAALLLERLGAANRVAAANFMGPPALLATTTAIGDAIRQLDAAFVAYRKHADGARADREEAAMALDSEIARVKLAAQRWE